MAKKNGSSLRYSLVARVSCHPPTPLYRNVAEVVVASPRDDGAARAAFLELNGLSNTDHEIKIEWLAKKPEEVLPIADQVILVTSEDDADEAESKGTGEIGGDSDPKGSGEKPTS